MWREVSNVLRNPDLILSGIDVMDTVAGKDLAEEAASIERELRSVQKQEDRAIYLYVAGGIDKRQLERQRVRINERLEILRGKLGSIRAQEATAADRRQATENIIAWMDEIGNDLNELAPEERRKILLTIVEGITVDRHNKVDIALAVPTGEMLSIVSPSPTCPATHSRPMRQP